jgi:hypothetical protein
MRALLAGSVILLSLVISAFVAQQVPLRVAYVDGVMQ